MARRLNYKSWESYSLNDLGLAYRDLGEVRKAIEYCEESLLIRREIGDRRGEAYSLHGKAVAFDTLGDSEEAIKLLEAALEIYEQIEDPWAKQARETLAQWRGQ
jgi:tetratricopeptide (TPR) repeat protein